ncbi:unnamed protein product [Anisakis simplex]|uniref:Uncharacterized protein n=1 Tax=Anisakis simplex TaxID=6269 RepID=A0A3P6QCU2_ANISI|nr:unnamed protein product [Anisakis simplex]
MKVSITGKSMTNSASVYCLSESEEPLRVEMNKNENDNSKSSFWDSVSVWHYICAGLVIFIVTAILVAILFCLFRCFHVENIVIHDPNGTIDAYGKLGERPIQLQPIRKSRI